MHQSTAKHITNHLVRVINIDTKGVFKVYSLLMDSEFSKIRDLLTQYNINKTTANEHVGEVKRWFCIIKERAPGVLGMLPFKKLPKVLIIHLVHFMTMWLNAWPIKTGISSTISPRELITGMTLTMKLHAWVPFGACCEIHDESSLTNLMIALTQPAISLGACGNLRGFVYVYCVNNGKVVKQWCFTELPMPDSININTGIEFYNCDLQPFEVNENDGENLELSST